MIFHHPICTNVKHLTDSTLNNVDLLCNPRGMHKNRYSICVCHLGVLENGGISKCCAGNRKLLSNFNFRSNVVNIPKKFAFAFLLGSLWQNLWNTMWHLHHTTMQKNTYLCDYGGSLFTFMHVSLRTVHCFISTLIGIKHFTRFIFLLFFVIGNVTTNIMIRKSLSIWQFTMCLFWLTSCKERREKKPLIAFSVKSMLVAQGYFVFFFEFLRFFWERSVS